MVIGAALGSTSKNHYLGLNLTVAETGQGLHANILKDDYSALKRCQYPIVLENTVDAEPALACQTPPLEVHCVLCIGAVRCLLNHFPRILEAYSEFRQTRPNVNFREALLSATPIEGWRDSPSDFN